MKTVTILKGLPASGKSTWAKQQIDKKPGSYTRVNKDDLRAMMHNSKWSKANEKLVLKVRNKIILETLDQGQHVIVDDTNLHEKHEKEIRELVKGKAVVQVKMFKIEPEEAVKRDLKRENSVGSKVIMDMFNRFLKPPVKNKYVPDISLPTAVICDIDGTIAHGIGVSRGPYDWDKVDTDTPDHKIIALVMMMHSVGIKVILMSGRDSESRELTEKWLEDNEVPYDELHMRATGDIRKDSEIKLELFNEHVRNKYNVELVFDDRNQMVDAWRSIGLKCLQVEPGDF